MAHLTDMEELLSLIDSKTIREYMREAMNCYMASAYRGCIVLSYIALFDDILAKLEQLGKINGAAKEIFDKASKKKDDQDVFESFLIDQLASKSLITHLDAAFLTTLRTLRNKSAHPSGHQPSPEEARFIFFETISRFLGRPILSTTQLVDEILNRLDNENFFPTSSIVDISTIVNEEVTKLHAQALPQLISKLGARVASTSGKAASNSEYFLIGLARSGGKDVESQIAERIVKEKCDDSRYSRLILSLVSSNAAVVRNLSGATLSRFKQLISDRISSIKDGENETKFAHPTSVLAAILRDIPDEQAILLYKSELEKLFHKSPYSGILLNSLKDRPKTADIYYEIVRAKASSSNWDTANDFSSSIEDLDGKFGPILSEQQSFGIVASIVNAAQWNAFSAMALVRTKFASIPAIFSKAKAFVKNQPAIAEIDLDSILDTKIEFEKFNEKYISEEGQDAGT